MTESVVTEQTEMRLMQWALGELSEQERRELEAEIARSPELARAAARVADDLGAVPLALEPVAPPPALRERVLASVGKTSRFSRFVARLAELISVTKDKAQALIDGIDEATSFEPSMVPGISLYHLEGGAAVANAIVGFIRIKPGVSFPHHTHLGEEIAYVVQGSYRDSSGAIVRAGDEVRMDPETDHELTALEGPDLIYLAVSYDGIRIGVIEFKPGDPRL
ncbi:MAG: cupin domain-containing protein [Myxococcales bacterium]|nr:cupin domain-containing protein [Myxococcales bacterium]